MRRKHMRFIAIWGQILLTVVTPYLFGQHSPFTDENGCVFRNKCHGFMQISVLGAKTNRDKLCQRFVRCHHRLCTGHTGMLLDENRLGTILDQVDTHGLEDEFDFVPC